MNMKSIAAFASLIVLTGCVNTQYAKSVAVTKDANGKVVQTVETEGVVQPNQNGWPVNFEHLKGVQPGN